MNDELNGPLEKLCAITQTYYWERLVNIDGRNRIFILQITMVIVFKKNIDVPFHIVEKKFKHKFYVAIHYLHVNPGFSLLEYRSNVITNDGYINDHQKVHRDYKITFPKTIIIFKQKSKTTRNKQRTDNHIQ